MTGFASFLSDEQRREYEAAFPSSTRTQYPTAGPSSFTYAQESTKKYTTPIKKDKGKAKAHEPVGTLFTMDEFEEDDLVSEMDTSDELSQSQWKHAKQASAEPTHPSNPSTYPNNIPLGSGEGHGLGNCPTIRDLINKGELSYDQEARKLSLPDGRHVRRYMDESLIDAAQRMKGNPGPRVMLGLIDSVAWEPRPAQAYYHADNRRTRIEEVYTESEPESVEELIVEEDSETDGETFYIEAMEPQGNGTTPHKIYLTVPSEIEEIHSPMVQAAERVPKDTRTARKEAFDGVHVTARDKSKTQALKNTSQDNNRTDTRPVQPASKMTQLPDFAPKEVPVDARKAPEIPERTNYEVADELRTTARAAGEPETTRNERAQDAQVLRRNPEEQARLIGKEILQLLRIWLAIWSLMGGWILIYLETKVRQQNAKDAYKREEGGVPSHTQQLASDMTNIAPDSVPSHEPPHTPSSPTSQIYEPIMFLDRTTTAQPRCRDSDTSHLTPVQVIDYSVRREWRNYLWQEPLHLRPGFSATAQLSYHGAEIDSDGQRIHRLSSLNTIQIITEPENGRSSTLLGHAFTYFLECPAVGQEWKGREAPYPTEERILNAMAALTHSDEPPLSFPCRGTTSPPLLPREVRELPTELTGIRATKYPEPERGRHPPNDSRWPGPEPSYEPDVSIYVLYANDSSPDTFKNKTSESVTSPPSSDTIETSPTTSSTSNESSIKFTALDTQPVFDEETLRQLDERIEEIRRGMEEDDEEEEEEEVAHAVNELTEEEERFFKWLDAQHRSHRLSDHSLPPISTQGDEDIGSDHESMPSLRTMSDDNEETEPVGPEQFSCPMCSDPPHQGSYRECPEWRGPSPTPTHPDSTYAQPLRCLIVDRTRIRPDTPIPPRVLLDSGAEVTLEEFTARRGGALENVPPVPQSNWTRADLQRWVDGTHRVVTTDDLEDWKQLPKNVRINLKLSSKEQSPEPLVHRYAWRHSFDLELTQNWPRLTFENDDTSIPEDNDEQAETDTEELVDELMNCAEEFLGKDVLDENLGEVVEQVTEIDKGKRNSALVAVPFRKPGPIHRAFSSSGSDDYLTTDSYEDIEPYQHSSFHDVFADPSPVDQRWYEPLFRPSSFEAHQSCSVETTNHTAGDQEPLFLPDTNSESEGLYSDEFLETCQKVTGQAVRPYSPDLDENYESTHWRKNCARDQQANKEWEMAWIVEPFEDARDIAYGELRHYLDPIAMATQDVATFLEPAVFTPLPLTAPIDDTSLHHTLELPHRTLPTDPQVKPPASRSAASVNSSSPTGNHGDRVVLARETKRKIDDRDSPLSPSPRRTKKFRKYASLRHLVLHSESVKAAYLANAHIISQYSRIRRDILEGIERAEEAITHHDDIDLEAVWVFYRNRQLTPNPIIPFLPPKDLPSTWERVHHPLLHDKEVEKLQMLRIAFSRHGRQLLADLIDETLSLRFRHGYALGHLLTNGYLDHYENTAIDYAESADEMWEGMSEDSFAVLPPGISDDKGINLIDTESRYRHLEEERQRCTEELSPRPNALPTNYDHMFSGRVILPHVTVAVN
ncbi:hypothetical protein C8J57DRAFT_1215805 [Mycena rebaudengoi]|nr:hypothetical protein C8J57DRAFT_1215805 [Mycena rebaudengoi]